MNCSPKTQCLAAVVLLGSVITTPASALGFLDDMIYSVKCAAADNVEACKAQEQQKFDDYTRNKNAGTGTITSTSMMEKQENDSAERCETVKASGPVDIDTVYIRAMRSYHFTALGDRHSVHIHSSYKHIQNPGISYDLLDFVKIPGYPNNPSAVANLLLYKSESGGTDVEVKYCLATGSKYPNQDFYNPAFWRDASNGFQKLVQKR